MPIHKNMRIYSSFKKELIYCTVYLNLLLKVSFHAKWKAKPFSRSFISYFLQSIAACYRASYRACYGAHFKRTRRALYHITQHCLLHGCSCFGWMFIFLLPFILIVDPLGWEILRGQPAYQLPIHIYSIHKFYLDSKIGFNVSELPPPPPPHPPQHLSSNRHL